RTSTNARWARACAAPASTATRCSSRRRFGCPTTAVRRPALDDRRSTLEDPVIRRIAERHGNSPAQMMLRWHLDHGRQVIPTSAPAGRLTENLDLIDVAPERGGARG